MSSRDVVLGRIRAALAGTSTPPPVAAPRDYRRDAGRPAGDPALVDLLVDRLTDYRATVHRVGPDAVAGAVAAVLAAAGARRVAVPPGLPGRWLPGTAEAVTDRDLSHAELAGVDAVLTGAAVAVAETGTIVLDGSPDQGRRVLTLLPDLHLCVVAAEQVVGTVPEAVARLDPTRPLTWISGPSATSDIELNRVEGVHGPRNLHVIVTDAP